MASQATHPQFRASFGCQHFQVAAAPGRDFKRAERDTPDAFGKLSAALGATGAAMDERYGQSSAAALSRILEELAGNSDLRETTLDRCGSIVRMAEC
jgi:hypothetical protein